MVEIKNFNKIIVANWKLNGSTSFVKDYIKGLDYNPNNSPSNCLIICPPVTYINQFINSDYLIGAQDCSIFKEGAYTGEISSKMLSDIGCNFCIIGHSERRALFNDIEINIKQKIENCFNDHIIPILCVGENLMQRKQGLTKDIIKDQLNLGLPKKFKSDQIILAYEPLWAIGTGIIPKTEEIHEIISFIKNDILNEKDYKILYGGSVKAENYKQILDLDDVDGLLIGGASVNIDEFNKILKF